MTQPMKWSLDQLKIEINTAKEIFRENRVKEPLKAYVMFFDEFRPVFEELIQNLDTITQQEVNRELLTEIVTDDQKRTAFRYLAAPPISDDDLKTLAEAKLSRSSLIADESALCRLRDSVLHILDPRRFPWVAEGRLPGESEKDTAIVASAALAAAQKVQTQRRSQAKASQESAVKELLESIGFVEEPRRSITHLADAPGPQEFTGECCFGSTRADFVIGLGDRRLLAIECKASNSEVNSFKRINHEAAGKAEKWLRDFGRKQVVPSAVVSGVYHAENLLDAQARDLYLFWSHRLSDLRNFIQSTT